MRDMHYLRDIDHDQSYASPAGHDVLRELSLTLILRNESSSSLSLSVSLRILKLGAVEGIDIYKLRVLVLVIEYDSLKGDLLTEALMTHDTCTDSNIN